MPLTIKVFKKDETFVTDANPIFEESIPCKHEVDGGVLFNDLPTRTEWEWEIKLVDGEYQHKLIEVAADE
jgi:hypothetical protein